MIESDDYVDPAHGIPVWSLYGATRRPTDAMLDGVDVVLVDLQDLGCRIYTFVTTLRYVLEEAARRGKAVWVLDRPNPGRAVRSRVCDCAPAGRASSAPGRCRCGTASRWASSRAGSSRPSRSTSSSRWSRCRAGSPATAPGYGWPQGELSWVNPSPNAGSVCDGALLSRHGADRGHERSPRAAARRAPLELIGAPGHRRDGAGARDGGARAGVAARLPAAHLLLRADLPEARGTLCAGVQIHVDDPAYDHDAFRPYRAGRAAAEGAAPAARPTRRCGATSPTSTSTTGWRST